MTFLDSYRAYLDKRTWMVDSFKTASGLMALASVTHKKVSLRYSVRTYYPNLYTLLIGPSGSGKGVAIEDTCMKIVSHVNPDCVIGQSKFTPEGLLKYLSEKDPCHITIFNDELNDIISAKKYMVGMGNNLITLYNATSTDRQDIIYSKDRYTIKDPCLNIFTGIQNSEISKVITTSDVGSGFLPRFCIFYTDTKGERPREDIGYIGYEDFKTAVDKLKYIDSIMRQIEEPIEIDIPSDSANDIYDYVDYLSEEYISDIDNACLKRINDQLFKLTLLYGINSLSEKAHNTFNTDKSEKSIVSDKSLRQNFDTDILDDTLTDPQNSTLAIEILDRNVSGFVSASRLISQTVDSVVLEELRAVIKKLAVSKPVKKDNAIFIRYRDIVRHYGKMTVQKLNPYISTLAIEGFIGEKTQIYTDSETKKATLCVEFKGE